MLRMCASNSHSYTHLIQALGIVRKPTVWVFITSKYPGTHDIGLPTHGAVLQAAVRPRCGATRRWQMISTRGVGSTATAWARIPPPTRKYVLLPTLQPFPQYRPLFLAREPYTKTIKVVVGFPSEAYSIEKCTLG